MSASPPPDVARATPRAGRTVSRGDVAGTPRDILTADEAPPAGRVECLPGPGPLRQGIWPLADAHRRRGVGAGSHVVLLVLLCAGAVLRVLWLQHQSLFVDEHAERVIAILPWSQLLDHPDGFPPLWFFVAHGWLDVFGFDASLRWLSVALGIVTVACCAGAARVVGGESAARWAAAVAAISPLAIWHAQESRPYSLLLALVAAFTWSCMRLVLRPRTRPSGRFSRLRGGGPWAAYGGTAVLGAWTHYLFAVPVAAVGIVLLARRDTRRTAVVVHAVVTACCLPLAALLRSDVTLQQELGTMGGRAAAGPGGVMYTYLSYVAGFSFGPSNRDLHEASLIEAARATVLPLMTVGLLLAALAVWSIRHWRAPGVARLAMAGTAPVLATIVLCGLLGLGFRPRYVNWGLAPLLVLAGVALARVRRPAQVAGFGLFAAIATISLLNRNLDDRYRVEDVRAAVAAITTIEERDAIPRGDGIGDPVAVVSGYMLPVVDHYVAADRVSRQVIGVPQIYADGRGLGDALASLPRHRPFWLFVVRSFHDDPASLLPDALTSRCHMRPFADVAGVEIYRVDDATSGGCDAVTTQ